MATLSEANLRKIWRGLMRYWSNQRELTAFEKAGLYDAIVAIDTFLNDNATAINNAFPAAFRTSATASQKSVILAAVALARYNPDLLRQLIGEVD